MPPQIPLVTRAAGPSVVRKLCLKCPQVCLGPHSSTPWGRPVTLLGELSSLLLLYSQARQPHTLNFWLLSPSLDLYEWLQRGPDGSTLWAHTLTNGKQEGELCAAGR